MINKVLTALFLICLAGSIAGQPPEGYYNSASGLTGKALQQALHDIIDGHTQLEYNDLWQCFSTSDIRADGVTVWDIYSDIPGGTPAYTYTIFTKQCGTYQKESDCYNREHTFPKSWFNDAAPMYTDLVHIFPTDGWVNNKRGNLPYGETANPSWTSTNGSLVGPGSVQGYTGTVFEPIDEYKGDLARIFFYIATRYYGEDTQWPGSEMTTGAQPKAWALPMLLAWHRADAVSPKEQIRNNEIFRYQGNRNPFIDDPQFAEKIWGTLNPVEETREDQLSVTLWPNPANDLLNISISGQPCTGIMLYVYDTGGCLVMIKQTDREVITLPVETLSPGLYFLRLTCEGMATTEPFLVAGN